MLQVHKLRHMLQTTIMFVFRNVLYLTLHMFQRKHAWISAQIHTTTTLLIINAIFAQHYVHHVLDYLLVLTVFLLIIWKMVHVLLNVQQTTLPMILQWPVSLLFPASPSLESMIPIHVKLLVLMVHTEIQMPTDVMLVLKHVRLVYLWQTVQHAITKRNMPNFSVSLIVREALSILLLFIIVLIIKLAWNHVQMALIWLSFSVNRVLVRVQHVLEVVQIVAYAPMVSIFKEIIVLPNVLKGISLLQQEDVFSVEMIVELP